MRNMVEEMRSLVHIGLRTYHHMNDLYLVTRQHANASSRWHTLMNVSSGMKRRRSCQQLHSTHRRWPRKAATDGTEGANTPAEHKGMPANKKHLISMVATPLVTFFFPATEIAGLDLQRLAIATRLILVVFGCLTVALSRGQRQPGRTHHLPAWKSRGLATGVVGSHFRFNQFSPMLLAGQSQLLVPLCQGLLVAHLVTLCQWMPQILGPGSLLLKQSVRNTANLPGTVFSPTLRQVPRWEAPWKAVLDTHYQGHLGAVCQCCTRPTHGLRLCCSLEPLLAEAAPSFGDGVTRLLLLLIRQISSSLG